MLDSVNVRRDRSAAGSTQRLADTNVPTDSLLSTPMLRNVTLRAGNLARLPAGAPKWCTVSTRLGRYNRPCLERQSKLPDGVGVNSTPNSKVNGRRKGAKAQRETAGLG